MTTSKQYDYLNRLLSISTAPGATNQLALAYSYAYNDVNQRTRVQLNDGSFWIYQYDALGQVTSGKKYWTDGTPVPGQQFEYGFDDIGNRSGTKAGGDQSGAGLRPATYSANTLNQYTSRTVPNAFDVLGIANVSSSVAVNTSAADYRRGEYFQELVGVNNNSTSVWQSVTVTTSGSGTNTGNVFVPVATETYGYDLDGNMTNDGRWSFTWDAENRLVSMQGISSVPSGAKKLDFAYDYQGRRIQKVVSTWNGSAYVAASTNKFLYDGWNLVAELNGTNGVLRTFMWGLDLSGTAQGAGGVGGLLAIKPAGANTLFVAYDGNGNVTGLIDATTGTTTGNYEYGPFGETIRLTPSANNQSPFRFSTKYTDDESDFLYYGFRYYNPNTGRWLSREPFGEWDGPNLHSFARNNSQLFIDIDGLQIFLSTPLDAVVRVGGQFGKVGYEDFTVPQQFYGPLGNQPVNPSGLGLTPPVPGPYPRPLFPPVPVAQPQPNPQPNPTQTRPPPVDQEGSAPHSGEWHVQLAGLKKLPHQRVIWRRQTPLTKSQGLERLDTLWNSLHGGLQSDLGDAFDDARKWVRSRPATGVPAFFPKSWPKNAGRCWHLDVEIVTGVAFVDDPVTPPRQNNALLANVWQ